jgi:hypothetical protein
MGCRLARNRQSEGTNETVAVGTEAIVNPRGLQHHHLVLLEMVTGLPRGSPGRAGQPWRRLCRPGFCPSRGEVVPLDPAQGKREM